MTASGYAIHQSFISKMNEQALGHVRHDYDVLGIQLSRRGIKIDDITKKAQAFAVAIPSWGVGTGGTRFARFPQEGEPRNIFEKLVDCATIHQLTRTTPRVSLHIPWDKPADQKELVEFASHLGVGIDAMNSNTFQDQSGQKWSYRFGSLSHTDPVVRKQAVAHNIECIEIGKALGSHALTVWIGDGGNFPGQIDFRKSLDRYIGSVEEIYAALPADWRLFIEYKLYEPAFYSTVINDWGTAYYVVNRLGPKAFCLVDLGHHAPNVNIEMIVSRLLHLGKLGGFHFNDSKYGDDDLDSGSVKPFQLFLIFHELVNASGNSPEPAYMIDQSHNVTDPIEALMSSAEEIQRAFLQALLVDRQHLSTCQESNDAVMALKVLKQAFTTDVSPILQMARYNQAGAIDPIGVYRQSMYRMHKAAERPVIAGTQAGIV
jgi:L-rhamnose isomerase/sugar isomerase